MVWSALPPIDWGYCCSTMKQTREECMVVKIKKSRDKALRFPARPQMCCKS